MNKPASNLLDIMFLIDDELALMYNTRSRGLSSAEATYEKGTCL
jgi:hypothetical protein